MQKNYQCKACGITTKQSFCSSCGADLRVVAGAESDKSNDFFENDPHLKIGDTTVEFAGFWKRFLAYLIDGLIMGASIYAITLGVTFLLALLGYYNDGIVIAIYSVVIICTVIYYSIFESSKFQATPGKMALGIKVTDSNFKKLSFGHALGRFLFKIISGVILYIGYIMAGFTPKKQALHDILAKTYVINND